MNITSCDFWVNEVAQILLVKLCRYCGNEGEIVYKYIRYFYLEFCVI